MKRALFVDRDGTIIVEPPVDYQVDSLEKLEFVPGAISALRSIAELDFELVMATNQDGLGTASFPEDTFHPAHNKMLKTLAGEGVVFADQLIDRSFPEDNAPTRKHRTGMFGKYLSCVEFRCKGNLVATKRGRRADVARQGVCSFLCAGER